MVGTGAAEGLSR
jgi:hypothetical protein